MNEKELYLELKLMLPKFGDLIQKVSDIDSRTKNIEGGLVGNEFNDHYGLINQFKEFRTEFTEYREKTDKRLDIVEHYKTGMKWGVSIVAFIATSTIFIKFTDGIKWVWDSIFR